MLWRIFCWSWWKQKQLTLKEIKLNKEITIIKNVPSDMQHEYDMQFAAIKQARENLNQLNLAIAWLKTFKHIQQNYLHNLTAFSEQYQRMKDNLHKHLLAAGWANFQKIILTTHSPTISINGASVRWPPQRLMTASSNNAETWRQPFQLIQVGRNACERWLS